jgi:hypothetical protein
MWLSKYGMVPGVALIHGRFGFVSSWFALAAPLHVARFATSAAALLGGLAFTVAIGQTFVSIIRIISVRARPADYFFFLSLLLASSHLTGQLVASSSPDVPVTLLTLVVVWVVLIISEQEAHDQPVRGANGRLIPLILSAGAFTLKLSTIPLLVVTYFYWLARVDSVKRYLLGSSLVAALCVPLVFSEIVTSGCPLYPSPFMCLDVPWSVTAQNAQRMSETIRNWARWGRCAPESSDRSCAPPAESHSWMWKWVGPFKAESWLLAVSLVSLPILMGSRGKEQVHGKNWVLAIAVLGISLILYSAPELRFGLGYFTILPALLAASYRGYILPLMIFMVGLPEAHPEYHPRKFATLVAVSVTSLMLIFLSKGKWLSPFIQTATLLVALLLPLKYVLVTGRANLSAYVGGSSPWRLPPEIQTPGRDDLRSKRVNNFDYVSPSGELNDRCWNATLPCTPYLTEESIELLDPKRGIEAGMIRSRPKGNP